MAKITGDEIEFKEYKRRTPLYVEKKPFVIENDLQEGDCIITFNSKLAATLRNVGLLLIKKINKLTKRNSCAIIYGKLPPEIKISQAQLFNSGALKYLVATDAVGMGLNLNIKRIIFSTIHKPTSQQKQALLSESEIKQIGGRAGRLEEKGGYVLGMNEKSIMHLNEVLANINLQYEKQAKHSNLSLKVDKSNEDSLEDDLSDAEGRDEVPPEIVIPDPDMSQASKDHQKFTSTQKEISKAILMPSYQHIEEFSNNVKVLIGKELKFSEIIRKLDSIAKVGGMYTLQNYDVICIVVLHKRAC